MKHDNYKVGYFSSPNSTIDYQKLWLKPKIDRLSSESASWRNNNKGILNATGSYKKRNVLEKYENTFISQCHNGISRFTQNKNIDSSTNYKDKNQKTLLHMAFMQNSSSEETDVLPAIVDSRVITPKTIDKFRKSYSHTLNYTKVKSNKDYLSNSKTLEPGFLPFKPEKHFPR